MCAKVGRLRGAIGGSVLASPLALLGSLGQAPAWCVRSVWSVEAVLRLWGPQLSPIACMRLVPHKAAEVHTGHLVRVQAYCGTVFGPYVMIWTSGE